MVGVFSNRYRKTNSLEVCDVNRYITARFHLSSPFPAPFFIRAGFKCNHRLDQACPTFLVLRATFTWGNLLRATNVLWRNNKLLWHDKPLDFDKFYAITRGDNESYSCQRKKQTTEKTIDANHQQLLRFDFLWCCWVKWPVLCTESAVNKLMQLSWFIP